MKKFFKKLLCLSLFAAIALPILAMPAFATAEASAAPHAATDSAEITLLATNYDIPKPDYLPGPSETVQTGEDTHDYVLNTTIPRLINMAIGLLGIAAFIGILISAITMLTAYGNEDKTTKAKTSLLYSFMGFGIVVLAYAIVSIIVSVSLPSEDSQQTTEDITTFIEHSIQAAIPSAHAVATNDEEVLDILFPSQTDLIESHDTDVSLPSGDLVTEIVPGIVVNLLYVVGFLVFISFCYGGVLLVIGRGNEDDISKAKNIMIFDVIALALIAGGYALVYGIATLNLDQDDTTDADDVYTEAIHTENQ